MFFNPSVEKMPHNNTTLASSILKVYSSGSSTIDGGNTVILWLIYHWENLWQTLNRKLGRPQRLSRHSGKEKMPAFDRNQTQLPVYKPQFIFIPFKCITL
jgi:hypothetical protein